MSNEFKIKNGLIVNNTIAITGIVSTLSNRADQLFAGDVIYSNLQTLSTSKLDTVVYQTVSSNNDSSYGFVSGMKSDILIPMGWNDNSQTTISYDLTGGVWSLSGTNYEYWNQGTKYISSTSLNFTVPDQHELHGYYIKLDPTNTLTTGYTLWNILGDVPISYVYWNPNGSYDSVGDTYSKDSFCLDERHTAQRISLPWHLNEHLTEGCKYISGFVLSGYTLFEYTSVVIPTSGDNAIYISDGAIMDEDLLWGLSELNTPSYTIMFRIGSATNDWRWSTNSPLPYLTTEGSSYLAYNHLNGGSYELDDLASDQYVNYYLCALPVCDKVNSPHRFIWIMGQAVYSTIADAQSETINDVNFGDIPFTELRPISQFTWRTNSSYTGVLGGCRLENTTRITEEKLTIFNSSIQTYHSTLVGRNLANQHPATAINTTPTGTILTAVDVQKNLYQTEVELTNINDDILSLSANKFETSTFNAFSADPLFDYVRVNTVKPYDGLTDTITLSSRFVGINKTLPQTNLHIYGSDIYNTDFYSVQPNGVLIDGVSGADKSIYYADDGELGFTDQIYRGEGGRFKYLWHEQSQTDIMVVSRGGRIGINKPEDIMNYHARYTGVSGQDDIAFGGIYTGANQTAYEIYIDSLDPLTNDTFKWRKSRDTFANSYGAWTTGIPCTLDGVEINDGVTASFDAVTGHSIDDSWRRSAFTQLPQGTFTVNPPMFVEIASTQNWQTAQPVFEDLTYNFASQVTRRSLEQISDTVVIPTGLVGAMYFGMYAPFHEISVVLNTIGVGVTLVVEYYKESVGWTALTFEDNELLDDTNNLTKRGSVSFGEPEEWAVSYLPGEESESGYNLYWIRLRSSTEVTTAPTAVAITPHSPLRFGVYSAFWNRAPSFSVDNIGRTVIGGQGGGTGNNMFQVYSTYNEPPPTGANICGTDSLVIFASDTSGSQNIINRLSLDSIIDAPRFVVACSRGNTERPANLQTNDAIGGFMYKAFVNGAWHNNMAEIAAVYTGDGTTSGSQLNFYTQGPVGTNYPEVKVMSLGLDGSGKTALSLSGGVAISKFTDDITSNSNSDVWTTSGVRLYHEANKADKLDVSAFETYSGNLDNSLTTDYVHTYGDQSISGNKTFVNNVFINGTMTATSAVFYNTQEAQLSSNFITLNSNLTGTPELDAGIDINRGNQDNAVIQWTESETQWQIGLSGDLKNIATEDYVQVYATNVVSGKLDTSTAAAMSAVLIGDINTKLAISDFNVYSGVVDGNVNSKLATSDFNTYSGTTLNSINGKVGYTEFNVYSGQVSIDVDAKLSTSTFNIYSGAINANNITAGNLNINRMPVSGVWNTTNQLTINNVVPSAGMIILPSTVTTPTSAAAGSGIIYFESTRPHFKNESGQIFSCGPFDNIYVKKTTAAQSSTLNNTFETVTEMSFAVKANTTYTFDFNIVYQSTNTNTGISFAVNGPASPTTIVYHTHVPTTAVLITHGSSSAYDVGTAVSTTTAANTDQLAKLYGTLVNGANAGTFVLRFKSESGTVVSVRPGTVGVLSQVR